jgi:hypothetical protein
MKKCKECLFEKELSDFDKISVNGYRGTCRKCRNKKNTESWLSKPENKEKRKEYNKEYFSNKWNNDVDYRKYMVLLSRIRNWIKANNLNFKKHIEENFTDDMNWENYGTYWEIDHIQPALKLIRNGISIDEINDFDNLRPLKIQENRERNKLP